MYEKDRLAAIARRWPLVDKRQADAMIREFEHAWSPFRGSLAPIPGGVCRAKREVLREMVANLANLRYVLFKFVRIEPSFHEPF